MNSIETTELTRRFGKLEVVHGLTRAVPQGSVFALLGPNGAGKSTTIKRLMNVIEPTSGAARVLGLDARLDTRKLGGKTKAQIGYVSENQPLPVWMTVRQFLDYGRPFYPTWDRVLENTLLVQFALPEDGQLKDLSRGMSMKAALSYRPKLRVLDEPFSRLDALVRDEFIGGVLEVDALGQWTVLVSSHDSDEVERLGDHVAMMIAGVLEIAEFALASQHRSRFFVRLCLLVSSRQSQQPSTCDRKAALRSTCVSHHPSDHYEPQHYTKRPARRRRSLRAPDQALEPTFQAVYFRSPPRRFDH